MQYSRWRKGTNDQDGDGSKGGSRPAKSQQENVKMATKNEDKIVTIDEGAVYRPKSGDGEDLIAFHVDRPAGVVFVAPVNSSREDRKTIEDMLENYTKVANQGEEIPARK